MTDPIDWRARAELAEEDNRQLRKQLSVGVGLAEQIARNMAVELEPGPAPTSVTDEDGRELLSFCWCTGCDCGISPCVTGPPEHVDPNCRPCAVSVSSEDGPCSDHKEPG